MKFVVLGHLIEREDIRKVFPLGRYLPLKLMEGFTFVLPDKKSFQVTSHFKVFDKAEGWIVGLPLTPYQMMNLPKEKVRKKIMEAALFSQRKLGAEILMLGALTAPLTSAGKWLVENPDIKMNITTGNTYTAAISVRAVEKVVDLAEVDLLDKKVAVVGAAGVIGQAIVKYFNRKGVELILVERTKEKLERLKDSLEGDKYRMSIELHSIREADIVVTATCHPDALIRPEFLKKNAVVIDVAEPSDVPSNINEVRPDVISIDGGRVKWENIDIGMNVGTPKNVGFACMTEAMLQALEERREDYIGEVSVHHLEETIEWGKKYGLTLANFTSFNKPIPLEKFKKVLK
jgi:fatty aldehyde-generating acyl-ACP reductase